MKSEMSQRRNSVLDEIWNVSKMGWCVGRDNKCLKDGLVHKTRKQSKREKVTAICGSVLVDILWIMFYRPQRKGR